MISLDLKKDKGILFAILSSITSSIGLIIAGIGTRLLTPLLFLSVVGIMGSIMLFAYIWITREKFSISEIKKNSKDLVSIIIYRSLIGQSLLFYGLSLSTGIVAIFFTKMEPYFVLIWGVILDKQKIDRKHFALLAIHLFGAFLLATGGVLSFSNNEFGDLLIIIAAAMLALSYKSGTKLSNNLGPIVPGVVSYGISAIIILPIAIFLVASTHATLQPSGWFYAFLEALLFNVLAITFWFAALKTLKGWIASALRATGPIIAAPIAFIVFGQTLGAVQILGGLIVLATSFIITQENKKK